MKTKFIPIDYDSFDWKGKNYLKIIGRNEKNQRVCVIDSCDAYLWAILKNKSSKNEIEKLIKKTEKIVLESKGRKTRVEKVELHNKRFLEKDVKALKIFATNYKDLHEIAEKLDPEIIDKRRGYDVPFITHYIIEKKLEPLKWHEISGEILNNSLEFGGIDMDIDVDFCIKAESIKKIKEEKFTPKTLAYDIETDSVKIGEGEILMISLVGKNFEKVLTWKKTKLEKQNYIEYVKDEEELLEKFCEYVREYSPDFLVGYFSDGFDLPYIKARADKLKVNLKLGLDDTPPKFTRGAMLTGKINGITHIDILRFIRTAYAQYMQSETLSLNEVAKEFLQDKKIDFELQHSSKMNEENLIEYYKYNLQDSSLTLRLFEKFWPDLMEFVKVIKEPPFNLSRNGLSKYLENYILHNLEKFNEIPEKRPTYHEISERKKSGGVEGAFVYEPKPGLYENLTMFDFTSMHTSIIISMNLSKSTLLEKKTKNSYESPELELNNKKQKFYFKKEPGFFPILLKELFDKRTQFKQEYKKNPNPITLARSNAFKVLSASAHGYIAFFGSRYYSIETSASILAFVRKFNQDIIKKVEENGLKVVYGDTDSVAFTNDNKTKTEIKNFLKKLNEELPGVMKLELEDFFKRGLWVTTRGGKTGAKKKYALLKEDNTIKIRGFETVRRDWCKLSRELQNKVIKEILKTGNEKSALKHTKEIIKKLKQREIDKKDLIIKTKLTKPIEEYKAISPHVVAAKKMQEQEIPISEGGLIEYYLAETPGSKLVRDKVKLPEEKGKYDLEYYLEKQIFPAVENIFQVFKINIKDFFEDSKQEGLDKWF